MITTKMSKKQRIIVSGLLAAASLVLKETVGYVPATIAAMLATTVVAGTPIFLKAAGALRYRIVGIDALVAIAVAGALFIGEYWEAAAVTFLFMLGDYLESRTIEKTRSSIKALLDLAPKTARVRRGEIELDIDLIDRVNPFSATYAVLSKAMDAQTLVQVQAVINAKKDKLTYEDARALAERALEFKRERGRLPSLTSQDAWERKMAEGIAFLQRYAAKAASNG